MKYKTFEEVLNAEDSLGAFKEYLAERRMSQAEFMSSKEGIEARAKAAKFRFGGPMAYKSEEQQK